MESDHSGGRERGREGEREGKWCGVCVWEGGGRGRVSEREGEGRRVGEVEKR